MRNPNLVYDRILRCYVFALVATASGCGYVPKTQFNACETQARILSEQSKAQLAEIANLKTHNRKLEDELLQAEKELASLEQRSDADKKRLTNFQVERDRVQEQVQGLVRGATLTGIVPVRDDDVEQLVKRFPLLRFDNVTGAYKLDADLAFEGSEVRIAPQSEKLLTDFASLFAEPVARDLRVLIVGRAASDGSPSSQPGAATKADGAAGAASAEEHRLSAERALAVAGFLKKVGLRSDQIGVSGLGGAKSPPAGAAAPAVEPRRVEIFVMGKKTPVVGWDDAPHNRF